MNTNRRRFLRAAGRSFANRQRDHRASGAQGALALMQGNARYAFEIMGVDIRMAGFTGSQDLGNFVNTPSPTTLSTLIDLANPLLGYDTYPPNRNPSGCTSACYLRGNSLTVVRADTGNKYAVTHTPGTSFDLETWPSSNAPAAGEIFVAADYTHTAVFQVGAINGDAKTVCYGSGASPGNSSTNLGTFSGGINALALYRLSGVSYYIGTNPIGEPALYRDKLDHKIITGTPTAISTAEELVQGVEDMEITYGVDISDPADGSVNGYWTATQVSAGTDGSLSMPVSITTASDRWKRVFSVRITLTLVSGQNEKVGTTGDKLLRKTFTNTLAIRNRLL